MEGWINSSMDSGKDGSTVPYAYLLAVFSPPTVRHLVRLRATYVVTIRPLTKHQERGTSTESKYGQDGRMDGLDDGQQNIKYGLKWINEDQSSTDLLYLFGQNTEDIFVYFHVRTFGLQQIMRIISQKQCTKHYWKFTRLYTNVMLCIDHSVLPVGTVSADVLPNHCRCQVNPVKPYQVTMNFLTIQSSCSQAPMIIQW